jgi:hypothetical protein
MENENDNAIIITNKVVKCKYCNTLCFWVKSKAGKWYLSTASYDANLKPIPCVISGKNGKFYQIHNCKERQDVLRGEK